jgi:hypothetical protein
MDEENKFVIRARIDSGNKFPTRKRPLFKTDRAPQI